MGLFSLFGAKPKSLDQGTRDQYARVAAAYTAAHVPDLDDVMTDIVASVVNARGAGTFAQTLSNGLVLAFARQLVTAAELYSPPPPQTALAVGETSLELGIRLRSLLDRKERLLTAYASHDEKARALIGEAIGKLFDVLPAPSGEGGETTFEVELAALLKNPPNFCTELLRHFFSGPLEGRESLLFHDFREKLLENAMAATPENAGVPVLFPDDQKERDPEKLFDLYFRGTGLAGLITTRMPFGIPRSARFEHAHIVGGS